MFTHPEKSKKYSSNLDIRPATKNDVPLILGFIRLLAECNNSTQNLVATNEVLEASLFGEKPYAEVIIPYLDQKPVGYALYTYTFSTLLGKPSIYLVDLFILQEARRQGIGRQMLAYLANLAEERNCGRLEWSVLQSNKKAISLYTNVGATPLNEWKSYRMSGNSLNKLASECKTTPTRNLLSKL